MATHCGLAVPVGSKFCPVCGASLVLDAGGGGDSISVGGISQSSGIAIGRGAQATVHQHGIDEKALAPLFAPIYQQARDRADSAVIDRTELLQIIQMVEAEAKKGDSASASKLERWLKALADVAPEILKSVVTVLSGTSSAVLGAVTKIFG